MEDDLELNAIKEEDGYVMYHIAEIKSIRKGSLGYMNQ